jgi:hypothetical protein
MRREREEKEKGKRRVGDEGTFFPFLFFSFSEGRDGSVFGWLEPLKSV